MGINRHVLDLYNDWSISILEEMDLGFGSLDSANSDYQKGFLGYMC